MLFLFAFLIAKQDNCRRCSGKDFELIEHCHVTGYVTNDEKQRTCDPGDLSTYREGVEHVFLLVVIAVNLFLLSKIRRSCLGGNCGDLF